MSMMAYLCELAADQPDAVGLWSVDDKAKLRNTITAHFRNKGTMQGELALTVASLMLGVHIEI